MGFNKELNYVLRLTPSERFPLGSVHKVVEWADNGTPVILFEGSMWVCFEENWESCYSFEENLEKILKE